MTMRTTTPSSGKQPPILVFSAGLAVLLLVADYFTGPFIQFPITYLVPIALVAWFNGRGWGLLFALVMPLVRFGFNMALWQAPWTAADAGINALIRIGVLSAFAVLVDRTARQTRQLEKRVDVLEGMLPICSICKRIKDPGDQWQPLEKYITERSDTAFSHGLCPSCLKEHYAEWAEPGDPSAASKR